MASPASSDVVLDVPPFLRMYKDGRVERFMGTATVPPSPLDPKTNVQSKDVVVSSQIPLSARLYLPQNPIPHKLPLLIYFHGGGFCIESASSPIYQNHLNALAAKSNAVVLSVDYRLAPEHPLPCAYDDAWASLQWVASHANRAGPEPWLNDYADFGRVFLAGDSAGANIAHRIAVRVGCEKLDGIKIHGIVLAHPYFLGTGPPREDGRGAVAENLWRFVCPGTSGSDDPWINPARDEEVKKMAGEKVLVCVAEKDFLSEIGRQYAEVVRRSGWGGRVEVSEAEGEDHVFHLLNPECEKAAVMMNLLDSFMN
ncbi:probable carboxylesterase 12 [Malania oleifera]|uniref:probable carboxylesterase 12 n=1 Tax=Malania oleifera TaxID=397392 RepID=UPI0025AE3111|nr:probable carboxylesterase 12 [Malania oleifera]